MKTKLLSLMIIMLVACFCVKKTERSGEKAVDFSLQSLGGQQVKLSDYKGKVVVVDFFATWCGPCRNEIPHLVNLYENNKNKDFMLLGISTEEVSVLESFKTDYNVTYPILLGTREVFEQYNVSPIPHTVFIDKKGKVRKVQIGFAVELLPVFETLIAELLSE